MKVVPPTCRPIFIYIPHLTSIKNKLAKFATMAIRAVLVDLMRLERTTSSLQETLSPIEIQTHMRRRALPCRLCLLMQSDTLVATMYPLTRYSLRFSIG